MRIVFMFLTFVVLLGACKGSQPADTTDVLVSVTYPKSFGGE